DGDRHGHLEVPVGALLEDRRRRNARDHVEVARRAAQRAILALAGDADAAAVTDSRRNLHPVALELHREAGARAGLARALDHLAAAAAARTRLADREEALALGVDTPATASGADDRRGAGLSPAAVAGRTGRLLRDRDDDLDPLHRLLERQPRLGLQVPPANGRLVAAPATSEEGGEDVAQVRGEASAAKAPRSEAREHAAGVVLLALLGVGQRVVGLLNLLEALLGFLVALVSIGVVLTRQLAVGTLDLVRGCVPRDPKHRVQVAGGHFLSLLADHDPSGPQHLVVQAIALLDRLDHDSRLHSVATGLDRQDLGGRRVESLARGVVCLDAGARQGRAELAVDERHPARQRLVS